MINKKVTILTILISLITLIVLTIFGYIVVLPKVVQSKVLKKTLNEIVYDIAKINLDYNQITLKTYLKPQIDFKIDNLSLTKNNVVLTELKNFENEIDTECELTCPYCGELFFTYIEGDEKEISCPYCSNPIELDWNDSQDNDKKNNNNN